MINGKDEIRCSENFDKNVVEFVLDKKNIDRYREEVPALVKKAEAMKASWDAEKAANSSKVSKLVRRTEAAAHRLMSSATNALSFTITTQSRKKKGDSGSQG